MKQLGFILFIFFGLYSHAQEVDLIDLQSMNKMINTPGSKLKVINFWASWCRPCILEMPYFDQIDPEKAEVIFITVDHPEDIEKAKKMTQKIKIKSRVYLLDESDTDKFIKSVDESWSGAIPATLFIDSSGRQYFYEKAMDKPELENFVDKYSSYNK